jgi:hypothetical protein
LTCTEEPVTIAANRNIEQDITTVDKLFQLVNKIRRTVFPDDSFYGLEFVCVTSRSGTYQDVEFPEDTRNPFGNVPGLKEKTTMADDLLTNLDPTFAFECEEGSAKAMSRGRFLKMACQGLQCGDIVVSSLLKII